MQLLDVTTHSVYIFVHNIFGLFQTPKPGPYVKDMADAGMFYSNRVLKDYKGK